MDDAGTCAMNAPAPSSGSRPLLEVRDLATHFHSPAGLVKAVDGLGFSLAPGETLGIVGESGCGKSITALSILGLVGGAPGIVGGSIRLDGEELIGLGERRLRDVRGRSIGMIFQEPMTSLNPVLTIGRQLTETIARADDAAGTSLQHRAVELLRIVRIAEPERRLKEYPHQLSGGMRQRVMIAIALACSPRLLIADEPTTALDVTVQAQILDLVMDLKDRLGMAIILITHDLGVVAETCDRAIVMYAGRKVEEGAVTELFAHPQHPYTRGLIGSIPHLGRSTGTRSRLIEIPGVVPSPARMPSGCRFAPRCALAVEQCGEAYPHWTEPRPSHFTACWRPGEATDDG
jgi:oligopeptide/dipeptide ABC transporter ATP-binding protein